MLPRHVVDNLQNVLGKESVITDREALLCYSYDATRLERLPDIIVKPVTPDEVVSILNIANHEKIPVIPRGAGTGFAGGSVPVQGGVVLSLQNMDRIIEINKDDMYMVVEPGVVTKAIQKAAEAEGLFYPPDPSSVNICTIGGNISTGAGGARGIKYGTTKDYVMGLDVAIASGEIISIGTRAPRSAAGYDLTRLMVGSEGTMGVITKAILRLIPLPEKTITVTALFSGMNSAASVISLLLKSPVRPSVLEFLDRESIRVVRDLLPLKAREKAEAMLLIELDGPEGTVDKGLPKIEEICKRSGALDFEVASTSSDRERLWTARRSVSPALYKINPTKINEDVVVPRSRLSELIVEIENISLKYKLQIVSFGHAGDGNLHINIMTDEKNHEEFERAKKAVKALFEATLRLNGSISGEHGIGVTKASFLSMEVGKMAIEIMKGIKKAFDPNNILNPGKLWI
ncbi:MAG: glycolate oxidase subunit GlcD [Nitrospirae bacterium RIFCSPLOW2_12_42_9]|nr:MAG: glycolate oxidase subunit GlcD [Nitrospirae bacterium RIFCSPLOW2_12_42_9]